MEIDTLEYIRTGIVLSLCGRSTTRDDTELYEGSFYRIMGKLYYKNIVRKAYSCIKISPQSPASDKTASLVSDLSVSFWTPTFLWNTWNILRDCHIEEINCLAIVM